MVISRIVRLRHPGVLRNFMWPADLPTFGRYNLIYGWNGSGKTIISRLLRDIEGRKPPEHGEVKFTINGTDVIGDDFPQVALPVRVFNRDFVTETVFPVDGGDVNPIFVLGEKNVEKQKEVVQLNTTLADGQTTLESVRRRHQDSETNLDKYCIDRATVIRETLRSSGSTNPYTNYDKSDFREHALGMVAKGDNEVQQLSDEVRGRLLTQHQATLKPRIQPISYRLPMLAALAASVSKELKTTVVSAVVQSLVDDPELSSWVHHGLELHKDHQTTMSRAV